MKEALRGDTSHPEGLLNAGENSIEFGRRFVRVLLFSYPCRAVCDSGAPELWGY